MRNNLRLWGVMALVPLMALLFAALLWHYQINLGTDESALAALTTRRQVEQLPAGRGIITDRNGRVLVDNEQSYTLALDLAEMGDTCAQGQVLLRLLELSDRWGQEWVEETDLTRPQYSYTDDAGQKQPSRLARLCRVMDWEQSDDLMEQMARTFGLEGVEPQQQRKVLGALYSLYLRQEELLWSDYSPVKNPSAEFLSAVGETGLPGVKLQPTTSRNIVYPYAAHLLGQVGAITAEEWDTGENYQARGYGMDEIVGLSGVEYAFESYLRGQTGQRITTTDREGNVLSVEETPALAGARVELTLDSALQQAAEQSLARHVPELNGNQGGAAAVVVDVRDGSILACASYPTYDGQSLTFDESAAQLSPLFNRALQGTYSPGSTYKMVTATAALTARAVTVEDEVNCTGYLDYYDTRFHCWIYREQGRTHGREALSDAITHSCNLYFYTLGLEVGIDALTQTARAFGLGMETGVELTEGVGSNAGQLDTQWYAGNLLSAAIGQSDNQFTPLQLANYIATLVNGGVRYRVHLLQSVTYPDGTTEEYQPQVAEQIPLQGEWVAAMKQGMAGVAAQTPAVRRAFAKLARAGISAGAKTGSAQVSGQSRANGLFVCFAPYDDPQVALCVAVERGGSGANTAVIAGEILESYFQIDQNRSTQDGDVVE